MRAGANALRTGPADAVLRWLPAWQGRLSPHGLRHFCASSPYARGVDLKAVQELLGHSWLSTTTAGPRTPPGRGCCQNYPAVKPCHPRRPHPRRGPRHRRRRSTPRRPVRPEHSSRHPLHQRRQPPRPRGRRSILTHNEGNRSPTIGSRGENTGACGPHPRQGASPPA
ncbi:tyrosine-type recombinase/integrase [Paractinoplanes toevensis]|uniref:tyrosine-type recombinase/integrase n=1 Tax=Paractinoplanes toevensis TaxID=571911 RepID=UPI001FEC7E84